ncbi:MAG TPA: class I SAM-dependent methyltransferase, partial [Planctomycetaceae bacterium]|nr:class I SAM-dependent methyltransferase [Planctomycetaceae bacterium]
QFAALGKAMDRVLTPNGRGLIHSIGRNAARRLDSWTEQRIFPGAEPPSLRQMMDIFEPFDFSVLDVENLRLHYAQTLHHWLERFDAAEETVRTQFDDKFVRMWRFYLAASIAAFRAGHLQLFQVVFSRARNNALPWTRADLYQRGPTDRFAPQPLKSRSGSFAGAP